MCVDLTTEVDDHGAPVSRYEWACVVGSGVLGGLVTTALFRLGLTGDPPLVVGVSIGVLLLLLTLSRKPR